ncbi:MAG TPA: hypothetical protein DCZ62_04870 [Ruminococcus sp.]|nr:hypothetical protein [Ruminococcus sp.]
MSTVLTSREATPVSIGPITLYCEGFKAQAVTAYHEEPTVSGGTEVTARLRRRTKLTFSGRVYGRGETFLLAMDAMTNTQGTLNIDYGQIRFTGCLIQGFSVQDNGQDFVDAQVTLLSGGSAPKEE